MKIIPLDLNQCIWENLDRPFFVPGYPHQFLLLKIMDPEIQNPIGFLGRIAPGSLSSLYPHENILPEKVQSKSINLRNREIAEKPIFAIFKETDEIIDHLRAGFDMGKSLTTYNRRGIMYELKHTDDPQWGDQLKSLFDTVDNMVIGDGHHRTAAYNEYLQKGNKSKGLYTGFFSHQQIAIYSFERRIIIPNEIKLEWWDRLNTHCEKKQIETIPDVIQPGRFVCIENNVSWELSWKDKGISFESSVDTLDVFLFHKHILSVRPDTRKEEWRKIKIEYVPHLNPTINHKSINSNLNEFIFIFAPVPSELLLEESIRGVTMPPKTTWIEPKMTSKIVNVPI